MKKSPKSLCTVILLALGLLLPRLAAGQSNELDAADRAHIIYDVSLDEIRNSELAKDLNLEENLQGDVLPPSEDFDITTLSRVYGAFQLPESVEALMSMGPNDDLPMNFFVRMEFNDPRGIEQILEEITDDEDTRVTERGGQTYYSPPEGQGPGNLMVTRVDERTLEIGTPTYLYLEDRNVVTEKAKAAWVKLPEEAVRLSVDLSDSQELIDGAMGMLRMTAGDEAGDLFEFVKDLRSLNFHMDPGSDALFTLFATASSEAKAEEVKGVVDGLLFMGRMTAKQGIRAMPVEDEDAKKMMNSVVDSLKATSSGEKVTISIPKPEGFEDMIKNVIGPAMRNAAETADKLNNFRQVGISIHNYADAYRKFPFAVSDDLSWRGAVMPFLWDEGMEYEIEQDSSWDDDSNTKFAAVAPGVFRLAKAGDMDESSTSVCWVKSDVNFFDDIRDGTSNTIMLIENPKGVAWLKPGDLTQDEALKIFTNLQDGQSIAVVMYDCSCRMIEKGEVSEDTFKALLTPSGGEVVNF